ASLLTVELLYERARKAQRKLIDAEDIEAVRKQCVFTTHTPVPAGHDRFPVDLMEFTLHPFAEWMKLSIAELMAYGQTPIDKEKNEFTMTILGLKLSRASNGVSEKHGEVSRLMW